MHVIPLWLSGGVGQDAISPPGRWCVCKGEGVEQALGIVIGLAHPVFCMLDLPVWNLEVAVWCSIKLGVELVPETCVP